MKDTGISSFEDAMELLMVVLDKRLSKLVDACRDPSHLNSTSLEMKKIHEAVGGIIGDIFAVKNAKSRAEGYVRNPDK